MYRYSMLLGLCLAMAAGVMAPLGAAGARTDAALLKQIASRLDGRTGVLAIEASDPVPYVASQPDPARSSIELRDVVTAGFADDFNADPRHPVAAVKVENTPVVRWQLGGARAPHAESADASPRSQRAQRHLRRSRSRRRDAERGGRHHQPRRAVDRHSRCARRQAWHGHGADAARDVASGHHQHSGAERRHAAAGHGHAERDLGAAGGHLDQAGTGRSRAHRRQSQGAADDAGDRRSDARGRLSRRAVAGRQRSDDRLRRAGHRSDCRAQDACRSGATSGAAGSRSAECAGQAAGPGGASRRTAPTGRGAGTRAIRATR